MRVKRERHKDKQTERSIASLKTQTRWYILEIKWNTDAEKVSEQKNKTNNKIQWQWLLKSPTVRSDKWREQQNKFL